VSTKGACGRGSCRSASGVADFAAAFRAGSEDGEVSDPHDAVTELTSLLTDHFGADLLGLYLFGSLAAGGFVPGKSDLDLLAVVTSDVADPQEMAALEKLHASFVSRHTDWIERVEVGYISPAVLQRLSGADAPVGRVAVTSPGEPFHQKDIGSDWILNWHGVCTYGETLVGPPPLELGPAVTEEGFRHAIEAQLREWTTSVRATWVAYVPAHQGYIVVTLCRALYGLATGQQTTKENAVAWAAERYPEWRPFMEAALVSHRADLSDAHRETIRFVDFALAEAEKDAGELA
jgi:hypothetical protein